MNQKPMNYLLAGLGDIAGSALFRRSIRYWWLTIPIGYVAWGAIKERRTKKTLTPHGVLCDVAPAISLAATLLMLNFTLDERDRRQAAEKASPVPPGSTVRDASFTATPAR